MSSTCTPAMVNQARFREACQRRGLTPNQDLFSLWQDCRATIQPTAAFAHFRQDSEYGPWIECHAMDDGSRAAFAAPAARADAVRDARNEALEEAAKLCDRFAARDMHPAECAGAIRAMKSNPKEPAK